MNYDSLAVFGFSSLVNVQCSLRFAGHRINLPLLGDRRKNIFASNFRSSSNVIISVDNCCGRSLIFAHLLARI